MNLDERIRDAVHAYTDPIRPAPDAWRRIRERVGAERRRRRASKARVAVAGFATAVVLALVVTLVAVVRDGEDDERGVTTAPADLAPSQIVAAIGDGRLVVLDATTGDEVRVLTDGVDSQTTIAVMPNGVRVFFDRPSTGTSGPPREIVTVPTAGGEVQRIVGESAQPAVSPDGTKLAFVSYQGPAGAAAPQLLQVVETDSVLGTPERVGYWEVGDATEQVVAPSWAPDSRHLVYTVVNSPEGSYPRMLDTAADSVLLDEAPTVPLPGGSCAEVAYLGESGRLVATTNAGADGRVRVIAVDPVSGDEIRELFRIPEQGCGRRVVSNDSGDAVLVIGSNATYRWSEGDAGPTQLAPDVVAVAWLTHRSSAASVRPDR
ncbi:MAG: TolB family protein [Acidimicrobiia bacterium]